MNLSWIKKVYLYAVSLISLIIMVIAGIMLVNLALRTWVFTKADDAYYFAPAQVCEMKNPDSAAANKCEISPEEAQKQRDDENNRRGAQKQQDAAQAVAMLVVAAPVFLYHWKLARKEQ